MTSQIRSQIMVVAAALLVGGGPARAAEAQVSSSVEVTVVTNGVAGGATLDPGLVEAITKSIQVSVSGAVSKAGMIQIGAGPSNAGGRVAPGGKIQLRTWLGIGTDEVGDDVRAQLPLAEGMGVIVRHVDADSPAAKAGIQANDILVKLDDQLLVNPAQLGQLIRLHKAGDVVVLAGLRKGKETQFKATLVPKEGGDTEPQLAVINIGGNAANIKIELPKEIRKLIEQNGGQTVFSTNITVGTPPVKVSP